MAEPTTKPPAGSEPVGVEAHRRRLKRARDARYRKNNRAKIRDRQLMRRYGITADQWQAMHDAQRGRCAICRKKKPLVVDHDHHTLRVRGLLCHGCNTAIGHFDETPKTMVAAARYCASAGKGET